MIAYGSNFGANKDLAERFAERSHFHGYTSDVITLNELAQSPPRPQPWLLVVMTSTYTSNPPSNATAFKSWLERTEPGDQTWRNCRYLVWGLGNTQWNAFLAFPRYVHKKLSELGATPLAEFGYGDVGSPVWERLHADWNGRIWPVLLELSGARPTAGRGRARRRREGGRWRADQFRLERRHAQVAGRRDVTSAAAGQPGEGVSSIMRVMSSASRRWPAIARRAADRRAGQHPAAGLPGPGDPDQRRRAGHGRGPRPGAAANSSRPVRRSGPGTWSSACRPASPTGPVIISASARRTTRSRSSGSRGTSAPRSTACSWCPRR